MRRRLYIVAVLTLSGCGILGPDQRVRLEVSTLGTFGDDDPILIPDTARLGIPFRVTITSEGGVCDRPGFITAGVSGSAIILEPFDYLDVTSDCILLGEDLVKTADITLRTLGRTPIEIRARRRISALDHGPDTTVDRVVTVVP